MGTYFLIIGLTLGFISIYTIDSMRSYTLQQKEVQVLGQANVIAGYIAQYQDLSRDSINFILQQQQLGSGGRVLMLDGDAVVTFDSNNSIMEGKIMPTPIVLGALRGSNNAEEGEDATGALIISAAVPITRDRSTVGVIYYQTSGADITQYVSQVKGIMAMLALLVVIFIGVVSFIMAGIITEPIRRLSKRLEEMAEENPDGKLETSAKGEIATLVNSFNLMTAKIRTQEEKRQEFVSNASHELKTPLSSIKLIADSLLNAPNADRETVEEFLTDMNVQVDRLTRIVNKLLTLTKMDNGANVARMEFSVMNLSEVCANVVKALRPLAEQKNISLDFFADGAIYSRIEKDRLWEAIYNILDNSIKYTPQGGKVSMDVAKEDGNAIITIEDSGIGIAPEEMYKIFDRFYRVDKARARETGGTGLGLSIALTAVELHGGNIQVESEEGKGSKFMIIIPITFK
ncbi:MAG: HAMP domain-containing protein [Oscillospiraceae bacterium]|nr:HAMP domain-containing protein [Oscillospiraceae bacterium]